MAQQSIRERIMMQERDNSSAAASQQAGSKRRSSRVIIFAALGLLLAAGAGLGFYFYPVMNGLLAEQAVAKPAKAVAAGKDDTPFQAHARQAGISECADVFSALGRALTAGSSYDIKTRWNTTSPDKHSVQAVVGMNYDTAEYKAGAVGIIMASPVDKTCEGSMVRVAPFQKTCQDIATTILQGSKVDVTLSGLQLFNLPNDGGQAFLVPVGNSCVAVTVAEAAERSK